MVNIDDDVSPGCGILSMAIKDKRHTHTDCRNLMGVSGIFTAMYKKQMQNCTSVN